MKITLQHLKYLLAISDKGSFSGAAKHLGISQPTLSQQIKNLEVIIGRTLFIRTNRQIKLSPSGQEIARYAREAISAVNRIHAATTTTKEITIFLGVVPSVSAYLFKHIIGELTKEYGERKIGIREGLGDKLISDVESGFCDIAIIPEPTTTQNLQSSPLYREELYVVRKIRRKSGGRPTHTIEVADLVDEELLTLENGHHLHEMTLRFCNQHNLNLNSNFEGSSLDTIREMVAAGLGVAIMPKLYIDAEVKPHPEIEAVQIKNITLSRTIYLVYRKDHIHEEEIKKLQKSIKNVASQIGCLPVRGNLV